MTSKTVLVFLLLLASYCQAQPLAVPRDATESDILTCKQFKKGLYRTFEEFRRNAPSITKDFELIGRSKSTQYWWGGSDFDIVLKDTTISRRSIKKSLWGFCDGDSIYINAHTYQPQSHGFDRIEYLGRYAYLESMNHQAASTGGMIGGLTGALIASAGDYEAGYVINLNNGKVYLLTDDALEKILDKDQELLQRYQQEAPKRKKAEKRQLKQQYIQWYNERHPEEIKQIIR